jgi:hypothetical protein
MKNIIFNIILLVNEYNLLIISAMVSFLILTFLIDGFKVSDNKYIRFLQIILLIIIGALFIIFIYEYFLGTPVECASNEEGNLSSHSQLKKDSEINLGLNGILDSQIFNGTDNSVEILLNSIYSLNIISLILIFTLILNLIIRLILNNNLELKWLNNLINQPNNNKFKSLIIKILKYIGKSNTINITLIIIILLISNIGSIYLLTILINNFEIFCKVYLNNIIK